jgi:plastocyanin
MRRTIKSVPIVLGAAALALVPATAGAGAAGTHRAKHRPVHKTVRIGDNYYSPTKLTVPVGSTITWKWPSTTGDSHDVNLGKRPKHVRAFHSQIAASDYSFRRRLTRPGTYNIFCSLHANMKMKIVVRR